jgi:hypothetical protein
VYLIRIIEYLSFVNKMGMMREDYTNPSYGYVPELGPSDYDNFQNDFTNLIRQKYQEGSELNPDLTGISALLNTATGTPFQIKDQNGNGVATIDPRGGFGIQGDNFGITLGPGIEGSYTSDDGKTNISAGLVPEGNNSYAANVNVGLGKIEQVNVPEEILMDLSQVDGTNEYIPQEQEIVEVKSPGQLELERHLKNKFGITPLGGVGIPMN